jgi:hypothetical protein
MIGGVFKAGMWIGIIVLLLLLPWFYGLLIGQKIDRDLP